MSGQQLKDAWQSGRATLNGWLAAPDPSVAENMAALDWDSLTIDLQHGLADYSQALSMLMALTTRRIPTLIRIPSLEEGFIMRLLDAGAHGLIAPMINSPEEVYRFTQACRYPPHGKRSFGPIRAKLHATTEDIEPLTFAMIENRQALDALEDILSVDALDGIYIGPADLSLSLGHEPCFDQEDPEVLAAIKHIIERTRARQKMVGVHNGSAAYATRMVELGANFVTVGSDLRFMTSAANAAINAFRCGLECTS